MDSQKSDIVRLETDPGTKKKHRNPFSAQQRKEERDKRRQKRARIIIRNISYKVTDENLKKHFEKYGKITDLNILKKIGGKLVGCAFIQYEKVNEAAKAILKANNKPFLGRPIFVDWALGKTEYENKTGPKEKLKTENTDETVINGDSIKSELDESVEIENDGSNNEKSTEEETDMENDSNNGNEEEDDEEDKKDVKSTIKQEKEHEKKISNDVTEGCTIFIKNVPFDATNNDLRKVCRKYGPLYYALVNTDAVSKHSKGTAFVKFKTKESAEMCLKAGEEFNLMNTVMEPFPALSRQDLCNKNNKKSESSDSRNLYLVKEGLIMTGSKAALGVSASDIAKRHKLEQVKSSVLKDLNRFVSRNRLSIHNLPPTYDDEKLKTLIINHTQLKPHECRVMRENKPSPGHPKGKSKGFGFMSFSTHFDALNALRKLNNNPTIFGATNRPIVGFSIEDRSVHNIKEKRLEKSRKNNPTYQKKLEKLKERKQTKLNAKILLKENKSDIQKTILNSQGNNKKGKNKEDFETNQNNDEFVGMPAKQGSFIKMRSNKKIRQQAMEHKKTVSEVKRKQKQRKEKQIHRMERKEIVRTKMGKKTFEKDNFSMLVNKYKNLVDSKAQKQDKSNKKLKRTKWYVE